MEVLVDRYVGVTDELQEIIEDMETQPLHQRVSAALKALPPSSSAMLRRDAQAQQQIALEAELRRYRAEVEEPAFAALQRDRSRRMRREPVAFVPSNDYAEVLDGIDLRLPDELPAPPGVAPLTLAVSWPPAHYLRSYPIAGLISSCHDGYLALHFGYPSSTGCYLVIDTKANSIAIVPPLPSECFTDKSRGSIGSGVGVGILHHQSGHYVLVELYLRRRDDGRHFGFWNKATVFMWWSTGSGALADQWIHKEVVLPLPLPPAAASRRLPLA